MGKAVGILAALGGGSVTLTEYTCCARRRRYLLVRVGYLLLLTILLVLQYRSALGQWANTGAFAVSHMADIAKSLGLCVEMFQFYAGQVLAATMLCSAVNGDIHGGRISGILTTPLGHFDVLWGKLLAKMYHVLVLHLCALPVLAAASSLGGLPWDFILLATAVSLLAALLTGSAALAMSTVCRHAWTALLVTAMIVPFSYLLLHAWTASWMRLPLSPVTAMALVVQRLLVPGSVTHIFLRILPYAAFCVGVSMFVTHRASKRLRRAHEVWMGEGLSSAGAVRDTIETAELLAQLAVRRQQPQTQPDAAAAGVKLMPHRARQREIGNSPVMWLTKRMRIVGKDSLISLLLTAPVCLIGFSYIGMMASIAEPAYHALILTLLFVLAVFGSTMLACFSVAAERQGRTLTILLATPIDSFRILWEKVRGIIGRWRLIWAIIFAHAMIFVVAGVLATVLMFNGFLLVFGTVSLAVAGGLYIGTFCRNTSHAMLGGMAMLFVWWFVLPGLAQYAVRIGLSEKDAGVREYSQAIGLVNPINTSWRLVCEARAVAPWQPDSSSNASQSITGFTTDLTMPLAIHASVQTALALGLLGLASRRLRKIGG